jgi:hypothetical protein
LCTDDIEPDDVLKRRHTNRVVRLAIEAGIPLRLEGTRRHQNSRVSVPYQTARGGSVSSTPGMVTVRGSGSSAVCSYPR